MNQPVKPFSKPAPLGRGLSALFGDADASYQAPRPAARTQAPQPTPQAAATPAASPASPSVVQAAAPLNSSPSHAAPERGVRMMPIAWIQPGAYQPRRHFDEEALQGLAESIRGRGILEPLLVRQLLDEKDSFEIIAGERRWRASQIAGLHEVPVIVRNLTDREALEFGIIENVQREDLSPLEEAEAYQRLMDEFDHTQDNLAKVVGKSRPHIANMLRILTLPAPVKQMIAAGALSFGHARAIIPARDPLALAQDVVKRGLSVRQTEALAKSHNDKPQKHAKKNAKHENADVLMLERELERLVGLKVKITTAGKAGSLTLYYNDLDQLDDVIKRLRT